MPKLAIDVVVLPDAKMSSKAVEVSKLQSEKSNGKILLNSENCLPHISLAMGVIDEKNVKEASGIIKEIASQFEIFELKVSKYRNSITPKGNIVSEFAIGKTDNLYDLHVTVMKKLGHLLTCDDATVGMVCSPPKVEEITLHWIKGFLRNSSFKNYKPHITLGFGQIENVEIPISFKPGALALCHLGNYCTCKKVLYSTDLGR